MQKALLTLVLSSWCALAGTFARADEAVSAPDQAAAVSNQTATSQDQAAAASDQTATAQDQAAAGSDQTATAPEQTPPSKPETREDIVNNARWDAMADLANLYLNDEPSSAFIDAGDDEKEKYDNYAGALAYYLAAVDRDKTNAWAAYQAGAAFAYLDMQDNAVKYLQEADMRGFWQYAIMQDDDELASMVSNDSYKTLLAHAKTRYAEHAHDAGTAVSYMPDSEAMPKDGWPVVVWLGGKGTENTDGLEDLQKVVEGKAMVIAVNGTLKLDEHSFMWDRSSTEPTEAAVQKALDAVAPTMIDRKHVVLVGFSQGALHAAHLLAEHPEQYAAALIVSPGGFQEKFAASAARDKRVIVVQGEQEGPRNKRLFTNIVATLTPGNQLTTYRHNGGHYYPKDWQPRFTVYLRYLLGNDATLNASVKEVSE